jgi:hypothetical protein
VCVSLNGGRMCSSPSMLRCRPSDGASVLHGILIWETKRKRLGFESCLVLLALVYSNNLFVHGLLFSGPPFRSRATDRSFSANGRRVMTSSRSSMSTRG